MTGAHRFASRLASGDRIADPVAIVVAHPDDETLFAGAALARLPNVKLIHLTDGAPRDMADARRLGLPTREAYADIRAVELDDALELLGAAPDRIGYGVTDQDAIGHLGSLVDRLAADLAGMGAVITHPFEGGHPDHDTAALAVRLAADALDRSPVIVEFACYHAIEGERRFGTFWPDEQHPEQVRVLGTEETARLDDAIGAYVSQASVIGGWRPRVERWRAAPRYDFARTPPPGEWLYDRFGWEMTSARWRDAAMVLA